MVTVLSEAVGGVLAVTPTVNVVVAVPLLPSFAVTVISEVPAATPASVIALASLSTVTVAAVSVAEVAE